MQSQYAALEYGLDDRALHDAVLGDFDADHAGAAASHARADDYLTDFVSDAVGDAEY